MRPRRITREPLSSGVEPRSQRAGEPTRRINITMTESQHDELVQRGVNVSGLIRELVEQYLSPSTITLNVDPDTRSLYEEAVVRSGATEADVTARLRRMMSDLLDDRLKELEALRRQLAKKR
jgi:hypothetical protein